MTINYLKRKINDWNGNVIREEYLHVRCVAHTLNLAVNDGFKEMHEFIIRVRNVVRYVRASLAKMQKFKAHVEKEKIITLQWS